VILLACGRETVACQTVSVPPMPPQTWNSPVSSESPPAWLVDEAPPAWVVEHATTENWPEDSIATWQAAFVDTGVRTVALTLDVRGATVDLSGKTTQTLNVDNAQPLHSALSRGIDRLRAMQKSAAGDKVRREARHAPPD
jgi:hypothetical protein